DGLQISTASQEPGRVCVAQVMHTHMETKPGCGKCWLPDALPEPIPRDVAVGVERSRSPGTIRARCSPDGSVDRVRVSAMLALAFAGRVTAQRAVPVLASGRAGLGQRER